MRYGTLQVDTRNAVISTPFVTQTSLRALFKATSTNTQASDFSSKVCRFRTGNHRLPITESRYEEGGRGVDLTKCKLCNLSDLCDEYHVLFVCKFFVEERKRYLKKYFYHRPNALKLHALFNSNMKQLSQLTKFIKIILSHF